MDDLRAMLLDFQQEQQRLLLNLQQSLHRFEEQLQAVTGQMNQLQLHTVLLTSGESTWPTTVYSQPG